MSPRRLLLAALTALVIGGALAGRMLLGPSSPSPPEHSVATKYQCSMHPQIVSDAPGTCPICQMKLQPVDEGPSGQRKPAFYRHPMRPDVVSPTPATDEMGMAYIPVYEEDLPRGGGEVPGHTSFTLSAERQQLIGVKRARVERRALDLEIRTVGKVAYDPELYQAIVEYREALAAKRQLRDSPWHEAQKGADAIIRAAALRLRQRGLSEEQIAGITRDGSDPTNLLLPGKSVWVYAQVYEYEVDLVRPGQQIELSAPFMPGRRYVAEVTAVDPILSAGTRTARVRALVPTPDESLRPETFVHAKIHVPLGEKLALPRTAVLDTGEHQIAFVVKGEGGFEPRSVTLGREAEGYYEVLSGLEAGEEVVTSANFLIDSESRFRAALEAFSRKAPGGHPH
jgi:hypothetical protein